MKKWIVRFATLFVFNVVVLLVIGLLMKSVVVGWSALWAGVVLTLATMLIKPWLHAFFQKRAAKSAGQRTKIAEKLVQFVLLFIVALIVWVLVVFLSGVNVSGVLWWWVTPPVILVIGWAIYDAIDDRVESHAGALYDRATGGAGSAGTDAVSSPSAESQAGRRELKDGLTDEQRRMLDEL